MDNTQQLQSIAMSDPTLRDLFGMKEPTGRELLISQTALACSFHNIQDYFEIVRMASSIAQREGGKAFGYYNSLYAQDEKHTRLAQKRLVNAILKTMHS